MKTNIFSMLAFGSMRYCRAQDRFQARRIFARSLNADRPKDLREIRVSLEQIRYVGSMIPEHLGAKGYDTECNRMPQRFKDETAGESYMNEKGFETDAIRNNAETVIDNLFAGLD